MNEATEQESNAEAAGQNERLVMPDFNEGDFVYYEEGGVGKITDVHIREDGKVFYRINYCQFKDPDRGTSGGNGPIWREGFPKPVTEPTDVLFVAAVKEKQRINKLELEIKEARNNFSSLKTAKKLLEA